jgi:peptidoglycan/LPS O-acetylase OafA/YrhL
LLVDEVPMLTSDRIKAAFSLRTNLRLLFVPRPDAVPAVTGIRALSMMWVLVQHVQQGLRPIGLTPAGAKFLAHPVLMLGWAGNLAIEAFFVISGYLVGGILMGERERTGAIDVRSFYVRRALRIIPVYVFAICVNLSLTMSVNKDAAWANLLFVNNFLPFRQQFMAHCWTLAIEEQFFLLSPLAILLLYRARPSLRTPLVWAAVASACLIALGVVFHDRLELSLRFPNGIEFWHYMDAFYTKPYTRFGSLAMGILIARADKDGRWKTWLERRSVLTAFFAALAVAATAYVIIVFPEGRGPSGEKLLFGSFKLALSGYVFGAAVAYMLLVSRTKHWVGRGINVLLGGRVLHVFAQLSYAMYLLHPSAITPLFPWLGFDIVHPWLSYVRILVSAFFVAAAVALVPFLFVELPIMRLRPRPAEKRAP